MSYFKKIILLFIFFLSIITLSACNKTHYPTIKEGQTIVALGDSLTFGYGGRGVSYPEELEKITGFNVINEGVNGDTTEDILKRMDTVVQERKPHYVLLSIGGNDMLRKVSDSQIKENLIKIIQFLKEQEIQVILIAEPRPKALGIVFLADADFYKEIAKQENILVIENIFSSLLTNQELKSDLIHLNDKGYKLVAENIAKELKKNGVISN